MFLFCQKAKKIVISPWMIHWRNILFFWLIFFDFAIKLL